MDTRRKIVRDRAGWSAPEGALAVAGPFDPLLAAHAEQLGRLKPEGRALVVFVTGPEDPILPLEARAELVAALGCVDAVVADGGAPPQGALDLTADHLAWREAFLRRVRETRQREADGAGGGAAAGR
jgi:bifunctional ADP-heptose synthase (sugar kinase/adenylyltransferase)